MQIVQLGANRCYRTSAQILVEQTDCPYNPDILYQNLYLPMQNQEISTPDARRNDLDALRAAAMLLGIVYHASLAFVPGLPWSVQDVSSNVVWYYFQAAVHGFRMPLFFLISGFFTAMLWRKRGWKALLSHRVKRVLVPLLLGLVTIVPLTNSVFGIAGVITAQARSAQAKAEPARANTWAAIRHGDIDALKGHLTSSEAANEMSPSMQIRPLTWAAILGNKPACELLLERGAEISGKNGDGGTALHAAAFFGSAEVAEWLVEHGADVNAKNYKGETPLHNAEVNIEHVPFIAGFLSLSVDLKQVAEGRAQLKSMLTSHGGILEPNETASTQPVSGTPILKPVTDFLLSPFLLSHLWFLWILFLLVVGFVVVSPMVAWSCSKEFVRRFVRSPWCLLLLLPLTFVTQWYMGFGNSEFGPDTSLGLIPMPHVLAYYAVFFLFGAYYFCADDEQGELCRSWVYWLPLSLLVIFPVAIVYSTSGASIANHIQASVYQSFYAWFMSISCMGLFRWSFARENAKVRYMSDASYWLYLLHLPAIVALQAATQSLLWWSGIKILIQVAVTVAVLLIVYHYCVRYTIIGTMLNGRRKREA